MNRRKFIAMTGTSIGLASMAGCVDGGEEGTANGGNGDSGGDAITIHDHSLESSALGAKVVGEAENTSGEEQSYVEIQARFFDSEGTRLGEGIDNASDVADGTRFNFEVISSVEASQVSDYELEWSTSGF